MSYCRVRTNRARWYVLWVGSQIVWIVCHVSLDSGDTDVSPVVARNGELMSASPSRIHEEYSAREPVIAVVNDEPVFLDVLQQFLNHEGYAVRTHIAELDVLPDLRREEPDIIVIDILPAFPERGFALLHEIENDPDLAGVPMIVMSVDERYLTEHDTELRRYGDLLVKPFDLDILKDKIDRLLTETATS